MVKRPAVAPATATKPIATKQTLTILHLYAEELNIYGDRGNILTLVKRLEWRGIKSTVIQAGIGDKPDIAGADIIFGGGGQDHGQVAVGKDLQRHAKALHAAAAAGTPMLAICGTYQLFGRGFTTLEGSEIPGIALFKARTAASRLRLIGNVIIDTPLGRLVGFENHSGRTILEEGQEALGTVVQGCGNDGRSGKEGAVTENVYGTYLHGPILPKNPLLADHLLLTALRRKYGVESLAPLNDYLEEATAQVAMRRPQ
ncbi:MAG TPA: glutamine amidotransferase [Candidatus Saccharimonadales bacterium]|nr:glutamine amidotransferase [Candidatus Saccharimonadales bacterium]